MTSHAKPSEAADATTAVVEAVGKAAGVKIPKWILGGGATGIGSLVAGFMLWLNSMSNGIARIDTKLDGFGERLWRVENKVFGVDGDRYDRRPPLSQRRDSAPDADNGSGGQ